MKIKKFWLTISLLILAVSPLSWADSPKEAPKGWVHPPVFSDAAEAGWIAHGNLFLDYAEDLNLTDVQVAALNKLRIRGREQNFQIQHKIYEQQVELSRLSHAAKPVRKKIKRVAKEIGKLKGTLIQQRVFHVLDAQGVLTQVQREKLLSRYAEGGRSEK